MDWESHALSQNNLRIIKYFKQDFHDDIPEWIDKSYTHGMNNPSHNKSIECKTGLIQRIKILILTRAYGQLKQSKRLILI